MRRAALICFLFVMSCSNTPAIPTPTGGGNTGTGGASTGGSSATGGSGGANGGGTAATGGSTGTGGGAADSGMVQMANDAGTCTSACDCNAGVSCQMGHCHQGNMPVYCCGAADCPNMSVCQRPMGGFGLCGGGGMRDGGNGFNFDAGTSLDGGRCQSTCDCPSGEACFQGGCIQNAPVQLYCCEDPACPANNFCQSGTGMFGRCGRDGGMGMMPPPTDAGAFDYCPFINCTDPGLCTMAGCTTCGAAGTCEK